MEHISWWAIVASASSFALGAVAGAVSGYYGQRFLDAVHRRLPFRRSAKFWTPWLSKDALIVAATKEERLEDQTRGTGAFDTMAVTSIAQFLGRLNPREFPSLRIEEYPRSWGERNVIAMGGPNNNAISARVMESRDLALMWRFDGNTVVGPRGAIVRQPVGRPGEQSFAVDYGIITFVPNPRMPERSVLVVAGCWGQGTYGGVLLLQRDARKLLRRTKGKYSKPSLKSTLTKRAR